ncbi:MAG: UDP-3-O-acyl-N-acetylglucosamine deacetylase [Spirulina sp. DLM2.Bin59]|nr:MAG: UDP-3-O-acyl-N-acetylglucosamine deacetylase [Spirulina sp. DLM2.Bin59]
MQQLTGLAQTIAQGVSRQGIGLHSGQTTQVRLLPAPAEQGRYFVRMDLPGEPAIAATLAQLGETTLSTALRAGEATIRTVEHLLAAVATAGITALRIEVDGPEIPLLDGSAQDWVEAIATVGIQTLNTPGPTPLILTEPLTVQQGDAFVTAIPAPQLQLSYGVDYPYGPIGQQWHSWQPEREDFATTIAPARTFGFADQIEQLRTLGLIKGGSLDNALVCDRDQWLNPPLRFANEPVRHKLLDLVGDLSLLGAFPRAHIVAYKASHQLHLQFAQALVQAQSKGGSSTIPIGIGVCP